MFAAGREQILAILLENISVFLYFLCTTLHLAAFCQELIEADFLSERFAELSHLADIAADNDVLEMGD